MIRFRNIVYILVWAGICLGGGGKVYGLTARNVILMIADGAGFNAFDCVSYYQHGRLGEQVYDGFPVKYGCTTWMLNADGTEQGYDPIACWSDFDYVEVRDSDAPPVWTRYYDLETENPIFCTRKGKITTNYKDLSRERRTGYSWYGSYPASLLKKEYPAWQRKQVKTGEGK